MQLFVTWPAGSKQKPQYLSNAGFFYQGKVSKPKFYLLQKTFPQNLKEYSNVQYKSEYCAVSM